MKVKIHSEMNKVRQSLTVGYDCSKSHKWVYHGTQKLEEFLLLKVDSMLW